MRPIVVRYLCALVCALSFHALLLTGAVHFGWLAPDDTTLPELDLSSVDLSFSDTLDEKAAPLATPPAAPVEEPLPSPPPPKSLSSAPPLLDPPSAPRTPAIPRSAEPRPTDLRPPSPEPPERKTEPPSQPQQPTLEVPETPAPRQARIAVDKPPAPRRPIKPAYPKGARQRGEEGDVTLELDVSADGTVDDVRIVASCGFTELEQAAILAVKRAIFTPARRSSSAVPATARLTLTFRLKD